MSNISIKAEGLGKQYIIGGAEQHYDSFRDMFANALKNPWKKYKTLQGEDQSLNRFWVLNDINFEIAKGEVVGVYLLYTSPSPRDQRGARMPSSA